jgi:hypothetical protein
MRNTVVLAAALILLVSGCTAGAAESAAATATAAVDTRVAELVAQTISAQFSDTPVSSATPSAMPMPTSTPTPEFLTISVSSLTNCRTGPGSAYDVVGRLLPGQTADALGRDASNDYWVIRNPSGDPAICWLWGKYATLSGDGQTLPIATRPPRPTAAADFSVSYVGTVNCGSDHALNFRIDNTGGRLLESIRIVITDNTLGKTFTHVADAFTRYDGCSVGGVQESLEPGEGSVTTSYDPGQMNYNPVGHSLTAVVFVCTADSLGGSCVSKAVNVVP